MTSPRALAATGVSPELRRHYDAYYGDGASEWRRLGALAKAQNVLALCAEWPHASVLEIGAGEGALLARLAELGFGERLFACEISSSGARAIRARDVLKDLPLRCASTARRCPSAMRASISPCFRTCSSTRSTRAGCSPKRRASRACSSSKCRWKTPGASRANSSLTPSGTSTSIRLRRLRRFVQTCGLEVLAERVALPAREAVANLGALGCAAASLTALKRLALHAAPGLLRASSPTTAPCCAAGWRRSRSLAPPRAS